MRIHRNAKTTPATRALMMARIAQGWRVAEIAGAAGVSRQTVAKWRGRYRRDGRAGLEDRSSVPAQQPRRTPARVVAAIIAARHLQWPAWRIAVRLQVPRSTVSAVLARVGLNTVAALRPPAAPVRRYEWARPGDLVHVDMKRLVRIGGVIGHRIHGDRRQGVRRVGWETVHVCVDDHSRAAYVEVLADQRTGSAVAFLRRAVRWFARRGVTVHRVMTDNGPSYCAHRFQAACARVRVRWLRTRPYRPQTNGKAERFIQTLVRDWAYGRPYRTSADRTRALASWLRYYNGQRPHAALDYQPPVARFPQVTR